MTRGIDLRRGDRSRTRPDACGDGTTDLRNDRPETPRDLAIPRPAAVRCLRPPMHRMRTGSTLYLDVEAYDTADTACADAVLAYTQSFDRAVRSRSYRPGFYGFSSSAAGIAKAAGQGAARNIEC